MTDCNDINKRLDEIEEEERLLNEAEAKLDAEINALTPKPKKSSGKKKKLETMSGDEIGIESSAWWAKVEADNVAFNSSDEIKDLVKDGFASRSKPMGSTGQMINFSQIPVTEENIATMLEVLALKRTASKKGIELMRPFTQQAATQGVIELARLRGGDPREIAKLLSSGLKGIDRLPINVYSTATMRWQSAQAYADMLDEVADAIPLGAVNDAMKMRLSNVAQWAYFYEQLDAQARRKVGQALRSYLFKGMDGDAVPLLDFDKDLSTLSYDDITGGSLLAQTLDHVKKGDVLELRKLATSKRIAGLTAAEINRPDWLTQVEILNTYRKDNLFSSFASWGVRNPGSVLVAFDYGLTDIAEGALRVGVKEELKALGHANKMLWQAQTTMMRNAKEAFTQGRTRMGGRNLKEISPEVLEETKQFVEASFDKSWTYFTSDELIKNPAKSPIVFFNLLNSSYRKVLGNLIENATGSTAGYMPSFRALNSFDEGLRTASFAWKTQHEGYLRAIEEGKGLIKEGSLKANELDDFALRRAEEMTDKALFNGMMTDDDLAKFRLREVGMPAGEGLSNDDLRLHLFNNLNGVPNVADELGRIGKERADRITFTQKPQNQVMIGMEIIRKFPLVSWVVPVWRTAANSIAWTLRRDIVASTFNWLAKEKGYRGGDVPLEALNLARAQALTAGFLAVGTYSLWQSGLFTDGGPFDDDPEQKERWFRNNQPYSFSLGATGFIAAAKLSGKSIDFLDLIGLHADVFRGWHDGFFSAKQLDEFAFMIMKAYARLLDRKSSLEGLTSILDMMTDPTRNDPVRTLSRQFNGILPISGLLGNVVRGFRDPNEIGTKRRFLTAEERTALEQDDIFPIIRPILNALQRIAEDSVSNYPVANQIFKKPTTQRDWLGSIIERPLGLPIDQTIPFMPVLKPQDPLYDWLTKHGFGNKPRPEGYVSDMSGLRAWRIQMTNDQEKTYRRAMFSIVGDLSASMVLGKNGANTVMGNIDRFIKGRDLRDALRALSLDEEYNSLLTLPAGPSLTKKPGESITQRTAGTLNDPNQLIKPINAIISYYDRLAIFQMMKAHPEFMERANAVTRQEVNSIKQGLEQSVQGVGRQ